MFHLHRPIKMIELINFGARFPKDMRHKHTSVVVLVRAVQSTCSSTQPAQPSHTQPVTTQSNYSDARPKPNIGRLVSSPLLQNPWNQTQWTFRWFWQILKLFGELFSLIWRISMAKTVRSSKDTPYLVILGTIWWKNHWIRQNLYQIQLDLTGSGVSILDQIVLVVEIHQIKLKNSPKSLRIYLILMVFRWVGFHGFWRRGLKTDLPTSSFGAQDPHPTIGAVDRVAAGWVRAGWAGGLDSPNFMHNFKLQKLTI